MVWSKMFDDTLDLCVSSKRLKYFFLILPDNSYQANTPTNERTKKNGLLQERRIPQ